MQRGDWRPSFLTDASARIEVPALMTQHPMLDADGFSWDLPRIDRIERWTPADEARWQVDPEAYEYVLALRRDPERLASLRRDAVAAAPNPGVRTALQRAFGDRLTIVHEDPDREVAFDLLYDILRPYFEQVTAVDDELAVRAAVEHFLSAFSNLDWEVFRACFADDATVFFPLDDQPRRVSGREAIESVFGPLFESWRAERNGPPNPSIEPRDVQVQMLGDDTAVVTFHLGEHSRRTLVFDAEGELWRIVHLHASSVEPSDSTRR